MKDIGVDMEDETLIPFVGIATLKENMGQEYAEEDLDQTIIFPLRKASWLCFIIQVIIPYPNTYSI